MSHILSWEGIRILRKPVLKVWQLIDVFRGHCSKMRGWDVCENDDLVKAKDEYHKFIWKTSVHPKTFEKVAANPFCCFREGSSLRKVGLSYMAWVLSQTPSESITRMMTEEPSFTKRIAIYDLSEAYSGKSACLGLNETESIVFREFEKFLRVEYDVRFQPFYKLPPLPPEEVPRQPERLSVGY